MKTASEISEESMADWPKDAPHLNLLREGIRQKIEGAVIAAQRDAAASAYEEAAKVAFDILAERVEQTFGRQSYEYQLIAISVDNAIRALAARAKESK